jgi:hypothetical protein
MIRESKKWLKPLKGNSFFSPLRARKTTLPRSAYVPCRARATSLYRWKNGDQRWSDATPQRPKNDSLGRFPAEESAGMMSKTHQLPVRASDHRSENDIFRHAALQNLARNTLVRTTHARNTSRRTCRGDCSHARHTKKRQSTRHPPRWRYESPPEKPIWTHARRTPRSTYDNLHGPTAMQYLLRQAVASAQLAFPLFGIARGTLEKRVLRPARKKQALSTLDKRVELHRTRR